MGEKVSVYNSFQGLVVLSKLKSNTIFYVFLSKIFVVRLFTEIVKFRRVLYGVLFRTSKVKN